VKVDPEAVTAAALLLGVSGGSTLGAFDPIWASVDGRPVLAWALHAFARFTGAAGVCPVPHRAARALAAVVLVVAPARVPDAQALLAAEEWVRTGVSLAVVASEPRWQDAVSAGLAALDALTPLAGRHPSTILVHDAARPLITPERIGAALAAALRAPAATAVEPVKETLKLVRDGRVMSTLPRERLVSTQTPQVFSRETLRALYAYHAPLTDDGAPSVASAAPDGAALALAAGLPVATFPGSPENLRVTTPADLALVEQLLRARHPHG